MKKCPKCGTETDSKICPKCSFDMQDIQNLDNNNNKKPESTKSGKLQGKLSKKLIAIVAAVVVLILCLYPGVIGPAMKYSKASSLLKKGNWIEAREIFLALDDYKDAKEQIVNCDNAELKEMINGSDPATMLNAQNGGLYFIEDGWMLGLGTQTRCSFQKVRIDGSQRTTIKDYSYPAYMVKKGEYIYMLLGSVGGSNIGNFELYRCNLSGSDLEKLSSGAKDELILSGENLYYSKCKDPFSRNHTGFYQSDLKGKNEKLIIDKAIYYPTVIGNRLFYQDDKDKERIHCYNMDTKEDIRITDERAYNFFVKGDCIYYTARNSKDVNLSKVKSDKDAVGKICRKNLFSDQTTVLRDMCMWAGLP